MWGAAGMIRIRRRAPRGLLALAAPGAWGAAAVGYRLTCPLAQQNGLAGRLASGAVIVAVGAGLVVHARRALGRELRRARAVAGAARRALLRPAPARVAGLGVAAAQIAADRNAPAGGDLYAVADTAHGVRVVMGDVRGHGAGAEDTVAAVLGGFREAVHEEPELGRVLRRLDRVLARHLRVKAAAGAADGEEFVTVLLLEIGADGAVSALNCGHPWPYLLRGRRVVPLTRGDPLPPLGLFPLPPELPPHRCGMMSPGETLVLHTDGVEDARDRSGRFFSLPAALARVAGGTPRAVLHGVLGGLLRHCGDVPQDDIALLVLRNERCGRWPAVRCRARRAGAAPEVPVPVPPTPPTPSGPPASVPAAGSSSVPVVPPVLPTPPVDPVAPPCLETPGTAPTP